MSALLATVFLVGCASAPYTGRSQVILVSERQEAALGDDAYRHILRDSVVTRDAKAERLVRKVGERIARAANKPEYKWEFTIINDPERSTPLPFLRPPGDMEQNGKKRG